MNGFLKVCITILLAPVVIPLVITGPSDESAVLVGEDDWAAMRETLYLAGIPGMTESLIEGTAESPRDCVDASALKW